MNLFPCAYKAQLDEQLKEQIEQLDFERKEIINRINSSSDNSIHNLNRSKDISEPEYLSFAGGGFVTGLIIGAFVCFTNGDAIDKKINFSSSIGSAIMFWVMFGIIGTFLALILCGIISAVQNISNQNIDGKVYELKSKNKENIAKENTRFDEKTKKVVNEIENLYQNYLKNFNDEAQKMSVRFAESPLAVEVIDWMTNGFAITIDVADRRSHIQEIIIPFVFRTYRNKIKCNLGTFDFEIERCDELKTPLEQTALTRAIASAIQLNITMKYPQDVSGTSVVTNITYDYKNDNVMATIVYIAPNGNYKATRGWAVN